MEKFSGGIEKDRIIRRYMSFENFEKLVKSQTMYFSRFDSFDDRLEGGVNARNFSSISNSLEVFDTFNLSWPSTRPRHEDEIAELQEVQTKINTETFPSLFGPQKKIDGDAYLQHISSWLYASCWTDLSHECHAMWNLFGSSGSNCHHESECIECKKTLGNSVCIETTIGSVEDSIEIKEGYNLAVRKVDYLDHRKTVFDENDMIYRPFFSKALHFSYESEVRFMLWPDRKDINFSYKYQKSTVNNIPSIQLRIKDMGSFINKIILSPLPPKKTKEITRQHMEQYKSALGLKEALSNVDLEKKVRGLLEDREINVDIVDSDLNQIRVTDCYTLG
ncbi:hypothetical protein [Vreelandella alkaliphila]|uniref:DUF2971 domain-containing protein n=1 Tax=Vreelandella alkaliphila TaxID=272774 RepID=A0A7C9JUX8_9GAMM|nr:hypothetical protein [Halomonas alkaliphila]NDL72265.1 hypothetical protein [Halomonas alkaliphila]